MLENVEGRADMPAKKHEAIMRLYRAWLRVPQYRLGQLLGVAAGGDRVAFYAEDFDLIERVEKYADCMADSLLAKGTQDTNGSADSSIARKECEDQCKILRTSEEPQ